MYDNRDCAAATSHTTDPLKYLPKYIRYSIHKMFVYKNAMQILPRV